MDNPQREWNISRKLVVSETMSGSGARGIIHASFRCIKTLVADSAVAYSAGLLAASLSMWEVVVLMMLTVLTIQFSLVGYSFIFMFLTMEIFYKNELNK